MISHALHSSRRISFYVISFMVVCGGLSCTPFKIDTYQECSKDSDCSKQPFERCDTNNFCIAENSLCFWRLPDGSESSTYSPSNGETILGVLANHEEVSRGGSKWSALIGLQSGIQTVIGDEVDPPAMIVCDPLVTEREKVLQAFTTYQVKTIIGSPLVNNEISQDYVYISIGLNDQLTETDTTLEPREGWLNLRPSQLAISQAFEVLSTILLNKVMDSVRSVSMMTEFYEPSFISMLALRQQTDPSTFVNNLIWRLSPYQDSNFRTLIVYFGLFFSIDQVVKDFLNSSSPLQYYITIEPSKPNGLAELIDTAVKQTTTISTSIPLHILSLMWDVNKPSIDSIEFWPNILQYSVIHGQYPHFYNDEMTQSPQDLTLMYEMALAQAETFDPDIKLPSPYFGLAFDAGVIAALIYRLSTREVTPYTVLNILTNPQSNDQILLQPEALNQAFSNELSGEEDWALNDYSLMGLSGLIASRSQGTDPLTPLLICSKNGNDVVAIPFTSLATPTLQDEEANIQDHFTVDVMPCEEN
jgi:hypothetical protein